MRTQPLLEVQQIHKRYDQGYELKPCSFTLHEASTCAFLGANGAGKSTLFQLLAGCSHATSGTVLFMGKHLVPEQHKLKHHIGYLPQHLPLPPWISGVELLRYAAGLYRLNHAQKRIDAMLDYWDCRSYATLPLAACSHGMQKRVALALALLHDPAMVILDEPFSGLDLYHTKALEDEIAMRQKRNKLTIISTHVIPYVVTLCQWVAVLQGGQLTQLHEWPSMQPEEKTQRIEGMFFRKRSPQSREVY